MSVTYVCTLNSMDLDLSICPGPGPIKLSPIRLYGTNDTHVLLTSAVCTHVLAAVAIRDEVVPLGTERIAFLESGS
jgi:hypothetical protein